MRRTASCGLSQQARFVAGDKLIFPRQGEIALQAPVIVDWSHVHSSGSPDLPLGQNEMPLTSGVSPSLLQASSRRALSFWHAEPTRKQSISTSRMALAAQRGGFLKQNEDNVTGLFYTPFDVHDLARKTRYTSQHPEDRRKIGEHARQWAGGRFSRSRYSSVIKKILDKVIGSSELGAQRPG